MNAIGVSHLTKHFDKLVALNDISFSVKEGETFGFLRPNGAGKTTTIRILTSIMVQTGGNAQIFGKDIVKETIAAWKQMGIVHETSNIHTDLTAWQNLMFTAELYDVGKQIVRNAGAIPALLGRRCIMISLHRRTYPSK